MRVEELKDKGKGYSGLLISVSFDKVSSLYPIPPPSLTCNAFHYDMQHGVNIRKTVKIFFSEPKSFRGDSGPSNILHLFWKFLQASSVTW